MHRRTVLKQLEEYARLWLDPRLKAEWSGSAIAANVQRFREFIGANEACFQRSLLTGHLTGSALVTNPQLDKVLLTLHSKLNMWLQLGGHADGHHLLHEVALRETEEESGFGAGAPIAILAYEKAMAEFLHIEVPHEFPVPFDIDAHLIPARKTEPEHYHYDVRFVVVVSDAIPLNITEESHDLRWFSLAEARAVTAEPSMRRQFAKLEFLRQKLGLGA